MLRNYNIKQLRNFFVLLIVASSYALIANASVYEWSDLQGVTHFSDSIPSKPKQMPISNILAKTDATRNLNPGLLKPNELHLSCKKLLIISPHNEENIFATDRLVVSIEVDSLPLKDNELELWLDNKQSNASLNQNNFILENIPRGEHVLKILLKNPKSNISICESAPVVFYMHQATMK